MYVSNVTCFLRGRDYSWLSLDVCGCGIWAWGSHTLIRGYATFVVTEVGSTAWGRTSVIFECLRQYRTRLEISCRNLRKGIQNTDNIPDNTEHAWKYQVGFTIRKAKYGLHIWKSEIIQNISECLRQYKTCLKISCEIYNKEYNSEKDVWKLNPKGWFRNNLKTVRWVYLSNNPANTCILI